MRNGAIRSLAIGAVISVMLAACGGDDGTGTAQGSPTAETPVAEESPTAEESPVAEAGTVQVAESDLGSILVDAQGMTLYLFEADTGGSSTCYDDCATAWPALTADEPVAGEGIDQALLGTIERDDGAVQVTYADHPLYHFASDKAAGDVKGQGVGDVWFVVDAQGKAVKGGGAGRGTGY